MSLLSRLAQKFEAKPDKAPEKVDITESAKTPILDSATPDQAPEAASPLQTDTINTLLSLIEDGVILLDKDNKVILANKAAEKITKQSSREMIGKIADDLMSAKDESAQDFSITSFCLNLNNNSAIVDLQHKDTEPSKIRLLAQSITDESTGAKCVLILHDVNQEKMFEQMQIDFVSMASHEFRTPLTSIMSYLSILAEEAGNKLSAEHKGFLERALTSSKALSALVDNILNVAKVERGSLSITPQPMDWQKNLTKVVEGTQAIAIQKNIDLKLELPEKPLPEVLADEMRINEVLNNLISNAITYTKEGGKITIGTKATTDEITTYVSDNGKGIPQDSIPHLFTKFFRVPGSLEGDNKGSGLGLYISKSIVDLHHGKIWVESKLDKGSTFYFSLPCADKTKNTHTIVNLHSK